jgi:hypothetical protein
MFNVVFVHWVRKASIGELGRRGDERRGEAHHISEENWGIGLEVSLLPLIHYTQHRGTTPTRKSSFLSFFLSFFLWEAKSNSNQSLMPKCVRHLETYEKMWGMGVVHHIHVYTCIPCRKKETQKPISSILYANFITCSTIPEPLKIATHPL